MEQKLAEAIRKALLENGIVFSEENPLEVRLRTANGSMDTRIAFPAVTLGKNLEDLMAVEISTLGLGTITCNTLKGMGMDTVGDVLNRVAKEGYRELMRQRRFAKKGFYNLRSALWDLGLTLDSNWKVLDYLHQDREWESRFPYSVRAR